MQVSNSRTYNIIDAWETNSKYTLWKFDMAIYVDHNLGKIKSSINRPLYIAILNHQKVEKDLTLTTPPKVTFGR